MAAPRVVFRLEFGGPSGWGHLARCAALAAELRTRGWTCSLWTNDDLNSVPADLRGPFAGTMPVADDPAAVPTADFLVVDWYGATDGLLRSWKSATRPAHLVVIDDEEQRVLDAADLIINSRLGLREARYRGSGRVLLGEAFVLLRPGLMRPLQVGPPFAPDDWPVLVMIGGSDPRGLTLPVLQGLADLGVKPLIPVVIGGANLGRDLTGVLSSFRTYVRLERVDAAELAGWARRCRGAVIGCGGSVYELGYLRLPFVGLLVAPNQRLLGQQVSLRWRLPVVDESVDTRPAVARAMRELLATDPQSLTFDGVDGEGARRVGDALESLPRQG